MIRTDEEQSPHACDDPTAARSAVLTADTRRAVSDRADAAKARLLERLGRGRPRAPKLSVVVPVYNVEHYVSECLDSLKAQTFTDFEVVVVDDGSTDRSMLVAREAIGSDPRFRVLRQDNAGLSAARNAGVRVAQGDYLTFLDSDDTLPSAAYATMMGTIERTGSDLVVGVVKRSDSERRFAMRLMRENHRRRRERMTVDEMPLILADVFATNKIFRRSFWDEGALEFPVGLHYEDQPTMTRALLAAESFDVIPETVYLWRLRLDGSSITQRRDDLADLEDRVVSKRLSTSYLVGAAPHVREVWFRDVLPVDMWEYFRAAPVASPEFWQVLRSAVAEFWNEETVPFDRTSVPVHHRLMGWLVSRDRREDLARVVAFLDRHPGDPPIEVRGGKVVALLPGVDDPGSDLPESVTVLGQHELRWETRVTEATWRDGQLALRGFALIRNVPTAGRPTDLTVKVVGSDPSGTVTEVPLAVEAVTDPGASRWVGRASQDYDRSGFACVVDVASLAALLPDRPATWRLVLERQVGAISGGGGVTSVDRTGIMRGWQSIPDRRATDRAVSGARARVRRVGGELLIEVQPAGDEPRLSVPSVQ